MIKKHTYWIIFFALSLVGTAVEDGQVSYDGAQVWRTSLRSESDAQLFKQLVDNRDISLWSLRPMEVDYLVHEDKMTLVHHALQVQNLSHSVLIMSVQRRIEETRGQPAPWDADSLRNGHRLDFKTYPALNVIEEFLEYLANSFPSICKLQSIGMSVENRTIKMIKISNGNPKNKPIIIESGLHPREWITITSALFIANNIVTKFDDQPDYMKNKEWYIIPVINPDGYEYTYKHDRLWRKNRLPHKNSKCVGVDLNRNFETLWAKSTETKDSHCHEDFPGEAPFSAPESRALRGFLNSFKPNKMPVAFIDIHSFGEMIIYPYGVRALQSKHLEVLKSTAEALRQGIRQATRYPHEYRVGSAPDLMYEAHGTAMDWCHAKGVVVSFAIETRDTGIYGFLLPPSKIDDVGKELLGAMKTLAKVVEPDDVVMRAEDDLHKWY